MKAFLILATFILSSCQTIVSISQSDMEVKKGHAIDVEVQELGYLNLIAPTNISVQKELAVKCPGGRITGVETMLLKRELVLVQIYDLKAQASCQDPIAKKDTPSTVR